MVLKVVVNMPKDPTKLYEKAAEELAKILVNKLRPKEVDKLIELLENDDTRVNF